MVFIAFLVSILALAAGAWLYRVVVAAPTSTERAQEIAAAISAGASAFLNRQYRTIAKVGFPILLIVGFFLGWWYAGGFLLGALASAAAGFIGMNVFKDPGWQKS